MDLFGTSSAQKPALGAQTGIKAFQMKHLEEEERQLWFCTTEILHPMLAALCTAGNSSPEYSEHFWNLFLLLILCLGKTTGVHLSTQNWQGSLLK